MILPVISSWGNNMSVKKRIQHLKDKRARGEKIPELRIEEAESIIKDSCNIMKIKEAHISLLKIPDWLNIKSKIL